MNARVVTAQDVASRLADGGSWPVDVVRTPTRWLVAGDPQTTTGRFFSVLERHGALADDGLLRADVGLVSMGDHFDFLMGHPEAERAGREILSWLAAQPNTVVLAGNHDVARVAELAFETDGSFAEARELARRMWETHEAGDLAKASVLADAFRERFPRIPSPSMVLRDFASFSVAQRTLVESVLLSGKMRIAAVGRRGRTPLLLTHAGVTKREMALLGAEGPLDPLAIAGRLASTLSSSIAAVRSSWESGTRRALDLEPLHVAGIGGKEGGGLLYHRPARPDREGADPEWEYDPKAPRRFDPRSLPLGLAQVVGHSGHARCVRSLGDWVSEEARADHVPLRTLRVGSTGVRYESGAREHVEGEASLVMVDAGFADAPLDTIALLEVDEVVVP